jgi:hypothetical protein
MNRRLLSTVAVLIASSVASANAQVSDREYQSAGVNELRLSVGGNVHLMPDPSAQSIKVHVVDHGPSLPQIRFTETRLGKRMTIGVTGPSQSLLPFTGASGYELQVTYPAAMKIDLKEFAGDVHADHLVGSSQIYNANGSITIDGSQAALTAEADNGSIDVSDVRANVQLTSGNGPVSAHLASGWRGNLVRIESSSGALELTVPQGFRGNYDLTTGDGKVHNPLRTVKGAAVVFMLTESGDIAIATSNGL